MADLHKLFGISTEPELKKDGQSSTHQQHLGQEASIRSSASQEVLNRLRRHSDQGQEVSNRLRPDNQKVEALASTVSGLLQDMRNVATLEHVSKAMASVTRYMDEISMNVAQETAHRRLEIEQLSTSVNENMSKAAGLLTQELNSFSEKIATLKTSTFAELRNDVADLSYRIGEQEWICNELNVRLESAPAPRQAAIEPVIEQQVEDVTSRVGLLADKQCALQEECVALRQYAEASEATNATLQVHMAQAQVQKAEIEELKAQLKDLNSHTNQTVNAEFAKLQEGGATVSASITDLQTKAEATRELLETQYQRLNARIDEMTPGFEAISELKVLLDASRTESENAITRVRTDIQIDLSAVEDRLQNGAESKVGEQLGLLEAKIGTSENTITHLLRDHAAMEEDIQNMRNSLGVQDTTLQDMEGLQNGYRKSLADLSGQVSTLSHNVAELQESRTAYSQGLESKLDRHFAEHLDERLRDLAFEVGHLKQEVSANTRSVSEVQENSSVCSQRVSERKKEFQQLANQFSTLRETIVEERVDDRNLYMREFHGLEERIQSALGRISQQEPVVGQLRESFSVDLVALEDRFKAAFEEVQKSRAALSQGLEGKLDRHFAEHLDVRLQAFEAQVGCLKQDVSANTRSISEVQETSTAFSQSLENKLDRHFTEHLDARLQEFSGHINGLKQDVSSNVQSIVDAEEKRIALSKGLEGKLDKHFADHLDGRLREFEGQVRCLTQELSANTRSVAEMQEHSSAFSQTLENKLDRNFTEHLDRRLQEFTGHINSLKEDVSSNVQRVADVEERRTALSQGLESKLDMHFAEHLDVRLQAFETQVGRLKQDVRTNVQSISEVQERSSAFSQKLENKLDRNFTEHLDARFQEFIGHINSLKQDVSANVQSIVEVQESRVALSQGLEGKLDRRFAEDLDVRLQAFESRVSGLQQDVSANVQSIVEVQERSSVFSQTLENKLNTHSTLTEHLDARLQEFTGHIHDLKQDVNANAQCIAEMQESKNALINGSEGKLDSHFAEHLDARLREFEGQVSCMQQEVSANTRSISEVHATHEAHMRVSEHLDALQARLEASQNVLSALQSKHADLNENILIDEEATDKLRADTAELRTNISEFRKDAEKIVQTLQLASQAQASLMRGELPRSNEEVIEERINVAMMNALDSIIGDLSILDAASKLKVSEHLRMLYTKAGDIEKDIASVRVENRGAHERSLKEVLPQVLTLKQLMSDNLCEYSRKLTHCQETQLKSSIALSQRMDQLVQDASLITSNGGSGQLLQLSERLDAVSAEQSKLSLFQDSLVQMQAEIKAARREIQDAGMPSRVQPVVLTSHSVSHREDTADSHILMSPSNPHPSGYAQRSSLPDRYPQRIPSTRTPVSSSYVVQASETGNSYVVQATETVMKQDNDTKKNDSVLSWLF